MSTSLRIKIPALIILVSAIFVTGAHSAEEYVQVQAAIGFETAYSGGRYTISQVAGIAKRGGISVIVTADAFLNNWQYGLWPLRRIIKKTEEGWSVSRYGIKRYLDDIRLAQDENRDMIIIGGLEVAPFYWWKGDPFRGNFSIRDWHKHFIVIGLETLKDMKSIPVIGPGASLAKNPGLNSAIYLFFPMLFLSAGIFGIITGLGAQSGVYERRHGLLLKQWLAAGVVFTVIGAALLINGYPFRDLKYDQYHGDRGALPYQNLIDYVNKRGGMTFWAHPEADNIEKAGKVDIETRGHSGLMLETRGYTGFAIFYEGYDIVGRPEGIWDKLLVEYCRGSRGSPVWAIGSIDYDRAGSLEERMRILRTVLLVKGPGKDGVMDALKAGRMYVSRDADAPKFRLDRFTAEDPSGEASATMGQEITVTGAPRIRIAGHFIDGESPSGPVKVLLIRDGEPLKILAADAPFDITYDDEKLESPGRHYYRVEIKSDRLLLVTNPVFVKKR